MGYGAPIHRSIMVSRNKFKIFQLTKMFRLDSMMFAMKRAVKVPGYYFFESEASGDELESQKVWRDLSYYSRFRVVYDIIVIEYLTNFFIFRWFFNIVRIIFSVIERRYPFLALHRFGKKFAYVEIMKSKKSAE